jgi:acetolactate synthase-1/2/3 large subunit
VIFAGNGVALSDASDELKEIAELAAMPVATTLMAKGVFPEDHALALGMTGIWGTRAANDTTRDADVILAIGTGFAEADCSSWDPEIYVCHSAVTTDSDRHRPAGDRKGLSGRSGHRR